MTMRRDYHRREMLRRDIPARSIGAEVGVFQGNYSAEILARVRPHRLVLIDIWAPMARKADPNWRGHQMDAAEWAEELERVKRRFAADIAAGRVEIRQGLSHEVAAAFPDGFFDWVYIDAAHAYADVRQDLESYGPKVKQGGRLFGHDYDLEGVRRAVADFCAKGEWALAFLTSEHAAPSFCLERT